MTTEKTMQQDLAMEFALPQPADAAVTAVQAAFEYTAAKMHLDNVEQVQSMLRAGRSDARGYFEYALARELAEHIGALDNEVQGVYLYNPEATPDDEAFGDFPATLVHLLVWARRKTGALNSLLDGLDRAVASEFAGRVGSKQTTMLDFQMVDDAEVNARSGFGAMLTWLHNRPLMVWTR